MLLCWDSLKGWIISQAKVHPWPGCVLIRLVRLENTNFITHTFKQIISQHWRVAGGIGRLCFWARNLFWFYSSLLSIRCSLNFHPSIQWWQTINLSIDLHSLYSLSRSEWFIQKYKHNKTVETYKKVLLWFRFSWAPKERQLKVHKALLELCCAVMSDGRSSHVDSSSTAGEAVTDMSQKIGQPT